MALTKAKISNLDTSIEFFQDPIILLNEKSTLANIDIGFVFNRNGGADPNVAIYWNETTKSFTLAYTANNGVVNSNISVNSYANITVGNIYSSGYYYADGSPFVSSGAANVTIQDEGNTLTTAVGTINFVGDGVSANATGNVVTVTITGNGSGGSANYLVLSNSSTVIDGSTANVWSGSFNTNLRDTWAGVFNKNSSTALFTFASNSSSVMSVQMDGSLFVGENWTTDALGVIPSYGGWIVASSGIKSAYSLYAGTDVTADGHIKSGSYIEFGDGTKQYTANAGSNYGNVNVKAYTESMGFQNYGNANVTAYLATADINTTGNITAHTITGNINVTGNISGTSSNVTIDAGGYTSVFDNQGNVTVPSLFASGNIQTSNYLFGNGAFLTGVVTGSSYGNVQVETYLPTYPGDLNSVGNIIASGNVSANSVYTDHYFYANGTPFVGGDPLPSQAGHAGEYLTTNGSTLSWASVTGGSGSFPVIDLGLITEPVTSFIDMGTLY